MSIIENSPTDSAVDAEILSPIDIFGPPPLINGESEADFRELLARIRSTAKPAHFLEDIWVYDVAVLTWEILRYRRIKASLLQIKSPNMVKTLLSPSLGPTAASTLAIDWAKNDRNAAKRLDRNLKSANLTQDAVNAMALIEHLSVFESIERLITSKEARRDAVLRELDRHRAAVAARLRQASADVEDATFEVVPRNPTTADGETASSAETTAEHATTTNGKTGFGGETAAEDATNAGGEP